MEKQKFFAHSTTNSP